MDKSKIQCDVCKEETEFNYGAIINGRGYLKGHKSCIAPLLEQFSYMRFGFGDGKGSYTKGWAKDLERRKVVHGEVVRDYGRTFSFGGSNSGASSRVSRRD